VAASLSISSIVAGRLRPTRSRPPRRQSDSATKNLRVPSGPRLCASTSPAGGSSACRPISPHLTAARHLSPRRLGECASMTRQRHTAWPTPKLDGCREHCRRVAIGGRVCLPVGHWLIAERGTPVHPDGLARVLETPCRSTSWRSGPRQQPGDHPTDSPGRRPTCRSPGSRCRSGPTDLWSPMCSDTVPTPRFVAQLLFDVGQPICHKTRSSGWHSGWARMTSSTKPPSCPSRFETVSPVDQPGQPGTRCASRRSVRPDPAITTGLCRHGPYTRRSRPRTVPPSVPRATPAS